MKPSSLFAAAALSLLSACAIEPTQPDPPDSESIDHATDDLFFPPIDFCLTAAPDVTHTISGTPAESFFATSGSGAYGYRSPCNSWLMDVRVGPSTIGVHQQLSISGASFDLPSSTPGPDLRLAPGTPFDCSKWYERVVFYGKLATESGFTRLGASVVKGHWISDKCVPYVASGTLTELLVYNTPVSGFDTYRIAYQTHLRSSFQEVDVWAEMQAIL